MDYQEFCNIFPECKISSHRHRGCGRYKERCHRHLVGQYLRFTMFADSLEGAWKKLPFFIERKLEDIDLENKPDVDERNFL